MNYLAFDSGVAWLHEKQPTFDKSMEVWLDGGLCKVCLAGQNIKWLKEGQLWKAIGTDDNVICDIMSGNQYEKFDDRWWYLIEEHNKTSVSKLDVYIMVNLLKQHCKRMEDSDTLDLLYYSSKKIIDKFS